MCFTGCQSPKALSSWSPCWLSQGRIKILWCPALDSLGATPLGSGVWLGKSGSYVPEIVFKNQR